MKIAITADIHLRSNKKERYENLKYILELIKQKKVHQLIIAGDLFDSGYTGYKEFDRIAKEYSEIELYIIPGNHDQSIIQDMFVEDNIKVLNKTIIKNIGGKDFLFLPYKSGSTINKELSSFNDLNKLRPNNWYLISHGDYGRTDKDNTGKEQGYFPITKKDINELMPKRIIFGHVHKPNNISDEVIYPGSPYPLDINEQGQRRILILDIDLNEIYIEYLDNTPVNFIREIFVYPSNNEYEQIDNQIDIINQETEKKYRGNNFIKNINYRLNLKGFSSSIEKLIGNLKEILNKRNIKNFEIISDDIMFTEEMSLSVLSERIKNEIEKNTNVENIKIKNNIFQKAMEIIYKV